MRYFSLWILRDEEVSSLTAAHLLTVHFTFGCAISTHCSHTAFGWGYSCSCSCLHCKNEFTACYVFCLLFYFFPKFFNTLLVPSLLLWRLACENHVSWTTMQTARLTFLTLAVPLAGLKAWGHSHIPSDCSMSHLILRITRYPHRKEWTQIPISGPSTIS